MASPAQRFQGWIESLSEAWKDRLRGWMMSWLARGINSLVNEVEPGLSLSVEETLFKVRDDPATPEALKNLINKVTAPGHPLPMLLIIPIALLMFVPTLTSIFQPLGNLWVYKQERVLKTARFDPISVITAWRRDPEKYAHLFDDLRDQGWSDESIEALKFVTLFYPGPAELVRWQAREVFEPDMISKYGLDDELGGIIREPFYKAGMTDEQITNYWRAHWEHASWMQIVEMLHRGLLTEQDVYEWFRLVEITPYWRDMLIQTAYTWPTRVDVRRFFDLKTIDEARLREIYAGMGYRGKNLDDYVLWTKIYVALPDLLARWKNGWITLDQVRSELIGYGMKADAADELIQTKVKATEPTSTTEGKELTKAEIYKGVKKEAITYEQAIELLMDLEYTQDQAEFLLYTNVEVLTGSPEKFSDFKNMTEKFRRAVGFKEAAMSEELKQAANKVLELTKEVEALTRAIKEEKGKLLDTEILPEEATVRVKDLQVALHRAEAELARVKTDYNAKVAEWRHRE